MIVATRPVQSAATDQYYSLSITLPSHAVRRRLIFIADEERHTTGANQNLCEPATLPASQPACSDIISDRPRLQTPRARSDDGPVATCGSTHDRSTSTRTEQQRQRPKTYYCNRIFNFSTFSVCASVISEKRQEHSADNP